MQSHGEQTFGSGVEENLKTGLGWSWVALETATGQGTASNVEGRAAMAGGSARTGE